jgi:L-lactate dehydrogenase
VKVGVVGVGAVGAATALSPTVDVRAGDYDALAGIGAVSARLAEAVLRDERAVLPVAAYAPRYEITLSLVSVLGAGGVQQFHEPAMTSDERAALERSAAALRQAARRVPAVRP